MGGVRTARALAIAATLFLLVAAPPAGAQAVRVRRSIGTLTPAQLDALRTGIAAMKARPASDPTSWAYQANIHGTVDAPPRPAWSTCQHGSFYFLSWHRMYLHYLERILRASAGSDELTLPYWDYSRPDQRALPQPFRIPPDASNPLFVQQRAPAANQGGTLPDSAVDAEESLLPIDFSTSSAAGTSFGGRRLAQPSHFSSFPGAVERQPHNVIHVLLGGPDGWMSDPDFAAQDPIFWLHHANIDRLWSRWLARGEGRANPTDAGWLDTRFTFFDERGTRVEMTGRQVVDTAGQLQYRYDDQPELPPPPEAAPRERQPTPLESVAVSTDAMELRGRPATTRIPVGTTERRDLTEAAAEPRGYVLTFEGIAYDRNPGVYYEVYLGLRAGETPDPRGPYYAGNLAVFALKPHGAQGAEVGERPELSLDVTRTIRRLREAGRLESGDLPITFVPRGMTAPGGAEAIPAEAPPLRFERVRLSTY
jgi:tyrosinase